jgi:hypothetical protein
MGRAGTHGPPFSLEALNASPIFAPLRAVGECLEWEQGRIPCPEAFNACAKELGLAERYGFRFVPPCDDDLSFESRIAQRREIECRPDSLHDVFNALTWLTFPRIKLAINELQASEFTPGRRSVLGNMLAHFEECGVVVLCSNPHLGELLKAFRWKELFVAHRDQVVRDMAVLVYGHGLYAKALRPYIGLTGHAIIVDVPPEGLDRSDDSIVEAGDLAVAEILVSGDRVQKARDLAPLPILGVPGWHPGNEASSFYDDASYFRNGRRQAAPDLD